MLERAWVLGQIALCILCYDRVVLRCVVACDEGGSISQVQRPKLLVVCQHPHVHPMQYAERSGNKTLFRFPVFLYGTNGFAICYAGKDDSGNFGWSVISVLCVCI